MSFKIIPMESEHHKSQQSLFSLQATATVKKNVRLLLGEHGFTLVHDLSVTQQYRNKECNNTILITL